MNSKGQRSKRDIVQFVPMNKFHRLSDLSKETLIEIPDQFLSYVRAHSIAPKAKSATTYNANQFAMTADQLHQQTLHQIPAYTAASAPPSKYDNAPLPPGWEKAFDESGIAYYVDHNSGTTSWKHPNEVADNLSNMQKSLR
jgi:hypothetical protein